jgi:hypothetical protein
MSARARVFWIIPALLVASWLAVQSLAASPAQDRTNRQNQGNRDSLLGDPPVPFASLSRELSDPALARYIGGLAAEARRN